jgi:hypothetical protein
MTRLRQASGQRIAVLVANGRRFSSVGVIAVMLHWLRLGSIFQENTNFL